MAYIEMNGIPLCDAPYFRREQFEKFFAGIGQRRSFPPCAGHPATQKADVELLRAAFPLANIQLVAGGCPSSGRDFDQD
jgi:hypothetical protein